MQQEGSSETTKPEDARAEATKDIGNSEHLTPRDALTLIRDFCKTQEEGGFNLPDDWHISGLTNLVQYVYERGRSDERAEVSKPLH